MFHVKHLGGGQGRRSRRPGLRPVSWILQRLPQQLPEDQHQDDACHQGRHGGQAITAAGEAGISSSQLMVIISPAMQAVTMPMV